MRKLFKKIDAFFDEVQELRKHGEKNMQDK